MARASVIGRLRLLGPARLAEQGAQVVVAAGQVLAELGPVGEVGGQSLPEGQGVRVGRLRLLQPVRVAEQDAQVVVAPGQVLTELGPGGEVGGQLLLEGERVGVGSLRFLRPAQTGEAGGPGCCRLLARSWRNRAGWGSRRPVASAELRASLKDVSASLAGPCRGAGCPGCCGSRPGPAELGPGGEVGDQLLLEGPGRRHRPPPLPSAGPWSRSRWPG